MNREGPPSEWVASEAPEEKEKKEHLVTATRISTVFSRPEVLEQIADKLMAQGLISGFSVEPVRAGYIYKGAEVKEQQYSLDILVTDDAPEKQKMDIRNLIDATISQHWDVPKITEESVGVNEEFLGFIKRAEVEHSRYRRERRSKLSFATAALLSLATMAGFAAKEFVKEREQAATLEERTKRLNDLSELRVQIEDKVNAMEDELASGKSLNEAPTDMAIQGGYEETQELMELVRKTEQTVRELTQNEAEKK